MAKANKNPAKQVTNPFHTKVKVSVSDSSKNIDQSDIKNQIVEAIKKNHAEQIGKGDPVISSYAGLNKLLSHLKPNEIEAALAQMDSVKIIDSLPGSLEFFPNLF
jgi:hypothetical protein